MYLRTSKGRIPLVFKRSLTNGTATASNASNNNTANAHNIANNTANNTSTYTKNNPSDTSSINSNNNNNINNSNSPVQLTDININQYLEDTSKKLEHRLKALRISETKQPSNILSKHLNQLAFGNVDLSKDERNVKVLQQINHLIQNTDAAKLVKIIDYNTFKLILNKIYAYHQHYLQKFDDLKAAHREFITKQNAIGLKQAVAKSQDFLQIKQQLKRVGALKQNTLLLAKDFFRIFENDESFSEKHLTINDYYLILKLESKNYKLDKVFKLFNTIEKKLVSGGSAADPIGALSDVNYWNMKLKVLSNAVPQLWKYQVELSPEKSTTAVTKPVAKTLWKGKHPFQISALAIISQLNELTEAGKVHPNLITHINIILGIGYLSNLELLEKHISNTWGISLDHHIANENDQNDIAAADEVVVSKDSAIYPDLNLMKAIVTAFSYNGQFLNAMQYLVKFDAKYHLKQTLLSNKKLDGQLWEIMFKWADYNTIVPSDEQITELIQEQKQNGGTNKSGRKSRRSEELAESLKEAELETSKQDYTNKRNQLLDNLFNIYLIEKPEHEYSIKILEMRFNNLVENNRLLQLVKELPIVYKAYLHDTKQLRQFYHNYLLMIVNLSFKDENLVNLQIAGSKGTSDEIVDLYNNQGGPVFMYNKINNNENSISNKDFFDSNKKVTGGDANFDYDFEKEYDSIISSYRYGKITAEFGILKQNFIDKLAATKLQKSESVNNVKQNEDDEAKSKLKNIEFLQLLEFYRHHDHRLMEQVYQRYFNLNREFISKPEYYKKLVADTFAKLQKKFDEEEDEEFFGIF